MPEHQRDSDGLAEHRAQQERELDVAHAHPGRVGEDARERGRARRRAPRATHSGLGWMARLGDQHDAEAGRTIRSGGSGARGRSPRPRPARRRRTPRRTASPDSPNARTQAATSSRVSRARPPGSAALIRTPQRAAAAAQQRATRRAGRCRARRSRVPQHMQAERGLTIERRARHARGDDVQEAPERKPGRETSAARASSIPPLYRRDSAGLAASR